MKVFAAAAVVGLLSTLPAMAQDKPAGAEHGFSKELLARCQTAALAKGLDTNARRQAIAACILQASPVLAARVHCLMNSRLRNMDRKAQLAFVKDCVRGKK